LRGRGFVYIIIKKEAHDNKGGGTVKKVLTLALAAGFAGAAMGGDVVVGNRELNLSIPFCGS
jgi:hypothetical protein